ncbi:hypothetical protein EJ110_NYTH39547 [Nymphaea thermarum]|nr:hypothetical protein EJ110_NYTH39547 [Nymphaea thermarum]
MDLRSGRTTMPGRMDIVQASPQVEVDPSIEGEVPSAELETQAVGRMVQLENEVLKMRQEMSVYKQQLSKLDDINEIKEMLWAMNANQASNQRPAPAPPSQVTPPPRPDKQKGVLGGPPSADPTPPPWRMQAVTSRPQLSWNPEQFEDYHGTNGGHNGQHVDPTVNIGGPSGHHNGYNGNNGGQQHSTSGLGNREPYGPQASQFENREPYGPQASQFGNREPYGPQASQYGPRFGGTQWENANTEHRWEDRPERDPPSWEPHREHYREPYRVPYREPYREPQHQYRPRDQPRALSVRVDFPRFDGTDPLGWIFLVEQYFICQNVPEEEWHHIAPLHVDGSARRAERITELKACFAKARSVEDRLQKKRELYRQWRAPNPVKGREVSQRPKQLPAPPRKEEPKPVYRSRVPPNMTREEREELIRNKKCYWCKDDWDPSHRCKNIRVYTVEQESYEVTEGEPPLEIEVIDEPEILEELLQPEEVQPPPEGACHMMNDPKEPDAMKVVGRVGNLDVLVLLDSGATHNFVGEHIADRLGSIVEEQSALRILVANGDSLPCTRRCTDVELTLQKVPFKVELLVVPLPNVDIILGVKWLKTLGRVWWDFSTMEMCLPKEGGEEVVLKAVDPSMEPKHRWVTRNGRPRHEVMIEWEGVDGGTSWELFDRIKTQFPTGAWGQAPSQEGGSDNGQPSTWPRAATDVAESSHRGRKRSAHHSVRAEHSSIDLGSGQGEGEGGVLQHGSADLEMLGVGAEGGAGGSATALSEGSDFLKSGSSPSVFKPTQAVFEPGLLGPT